MSDERTIDELADEVRGFESGGISDSAYLQARAADDALDELVRRADEAAVYKRALKMACSCTYCHHLNDPKCMTKTADERSLCSEVFVDWHIAQAEEADE